MSIIYSPRFFKFVIINLMNIGVFDSGIGGQAIAMELEKVFENAKFTVVDDKKHVPYGSRETEEIIELTDKAIQPLLISNDVIVLACNTATAAAIETLRAKYPTMPFVGLEPMLKPAAVSTKSGVIAVCATPATLASDRYQNLKKRYAGEVKVLEPDCSDWARMIEHNQIDEDRIRLIVDEVCDDNADVIVLACTHYHWIKQTIQSQAAGRAEIIEPTEAVVRQIKNLLNL